MLLNVALVLHRIILYVQSVYFESFISQIGSTATIRHYKLDEVIDLEVVRPVLIFVDDLRIRDVQISLADIATVDQIQ